MEFSEFNRGVTVVSAVGAAGLLGLLIKYRADVFRVVSAVVGFPNRLKRVEGILTAHVGEDRQELKKLADAIARDATASVTAHTAMAEKITAAATETIKTLGGLREEVSGLRGEVRGLITGLGLHRDRDTDDSKPPKSSKEGQEGADDEPS